jgi:hypothetical protein
MFEQVMLAMVTSAGSAALAWFLCSQYKDMEARRGEDRSREVQLEAKRRLALLKAKLEVRVAQARLDEARRLALLLAGRLPGIPADALMPMESQPLPAGDSGRRWAHSHRAEPASLMPAMAGAKPEAIIRRQAG